MNSASLNLDTRQRAMLLEMGVQVWLPEAPLAESPVAPLPPAREGFAGHDESARAAGLRAPAQAVPAGQAPVSPLPPGSRPAAQRPVTPTPAASAQDGRQSAGLPAASASGAASAVSVRPETPGAQPAAWLLGQAQPLYAQSAETAQTSGGARWLVLAETPPTALPGGVLADFSAFDGDAGQLLANMLRAARLDGAALALLAPLVRQGAGAVTPAFSAALAALVAQTQPDIVLVMGRLAALALLPTGAPFGKLRGQVHTLHGARAIVTYDAPYLLRTPGDKAKAWADLCLAMSLSAAP